jgi:hypothetical protein
MLSARITPRLEQHLERLQAAMEEEDNYLREKYQHRNEVKTRAQQLEEEQRLMTAMKIDEHQNRSLAAQQESAAKHAAWLRRQKEQEFNSRESVERRRRERMSWEVRFEREQHQRLMTKDQKHEEFIRNRANETAQRNYERQKRLEENRRRQAELKAQADREKHRQEMEHRMLAKQIHDEHRVQFLQRMEEDYMKVKAAQARNEELEQQRIRAEEERMHQEELRRQAAIEARNAEIRRRQQMKEERMQRAQRSVEEANRQRQLYEAQCEAQFQESLLIGAQTRQFNALHRRSGTYVKSRSVSSSQ